MYDLTHIIHPASYNLNEERRIDMSRMSLTELRRKDVINVCDGARLGTITELEFDSCNGQICSLILSTCCGFFSFKSERRIQLPWNRIECIGDDAILVKLSQNDLEALSQLQKCKKNNVFD